MAELLKEVYSIKFAISWSGACHDGIGVFKGWFDEYYQEALENGYAKIPMFWRENLLFSKNLQNKTACVSSLKMIFFS